MTNFTVWVDADSCPVSVRELLIRFANRLNVQTKFVANRIIPLPFSSVLSMHIADETPDAADNFIVENCSANDIVITRDVPLAVRLVEKKLIVLNDRGKLYTPENIRESLSFRNFNLELVESGLPEKKTGMYTKKDLNLFANCLDRELQKKFKNTTECL